MAKVSSSNTTTLYSTTQTTPVQQGASVNTGKVNDNNFTTLYSNGSQSRTGGSSGNLLVNGNLRVTGTSDLEGAVTIGNSYTLPTADGTVDQVLTTDGAGNVYWANNSDVNTTYTINASTTTGGADFNLVGSDATVDTIKFAGSGNTTVTRTDANTITISSTGGGGPTTFGNITVAVVDDNTISTTTGDLFLQSTGGEVQVNGNFEVTGNGNFRGIVAINNDQTATNPSYQAYSGASLGSLTWDGSSWTATGGINSDGADFGNITIAVVNDNTISTTTGDLTITSAGSYVNINQIINSTADYLNLNSDNTANDSAIRFGNSKELKWDYANDRFEFNNELNVTGTLTVQADAITINSDKTNNDTYLNFGRVAPNNNSAIRWNATTNRFEFNADGTSPTNWSPFVQTLDDLSDVNITTPAAGNVLYYDGSNFVNGSTVTSLTGNTRFTTTYQNNTSTSTASLRVNRDYDTYTYVAGDSTAVQYQITSDTQPTVGIGLTGFAYSATDPSFIAVTSADNFTTRTTVMDVNGTDAQFDAANVILNYNLTGAATDAFYSVNRGSTGVDVALRWNASTNKWQFTNDGTTYYDMADNSGHTFGNVTVGSVTPNTISTTTGDLLITAATSAISITGSTTITGDLNVQGGDITNSTGELRITSGSTDSNIVLTPSGTGDVLLTADVVQIGDPNTNANLTTNGTGDLVLNTNNGTNSGQITILNGANANINIVPNGTGDVLLTADTVQVGDANTAATITTNGTGNLILNTNSGTNAGSITLAQGTNGNITLDPDGSGSVALTLADGGNLTNTRNYVKGAIRNSTLAAAGEIWAVNSTGPSNPYQGINIDNSADTTTGPGTVLRSFSGGAVAGSGTRGRFIFEKARGTSASPTANQSGDILGSLDATGYTSTGWLNDNIAAVTPCFFGFNASENWVSNTNLGTGLTLSLAPTATTITSAANLVNILVVNPQTFASRSDAYTWSQGKTGTTQNMALDVNGNLTVRGDLTVTGNDIKNSGGSNVITMSSGNTQTDITSNILYIKEPTTASTYGNASTIGINAGNPAAAAFNDRISQFRVSTATTSGSEASTITFNTGKYNTGTNLFSATQSGDYLGEFFFAGNYGTTSGFTTLGPSVRFRATAAENFTATNSGGAFAINLDKIGGSTPYDAISINSSNASIASDIITLENNSGTDYAVFNSTSATFAQPVGFPVKTAAQWNAITGAVGQQVCVSDSAQGSNPNGMMAFWDTTNSRWSYIHDNSAV